jgi:hypothetical protein
MQIGLHLLFCDETLDLHVLEVCWNLELRPLFRDFDHEQIRSGIFLHNSELYAKFCDCWTLFFR